MSNFFFFFFIDSSAYYGPSEIIVGSALDRIRDKYPRNSYVICTKAGRVKENEFDYSPAHIRSSVERSLERFHTDYIDVLYLHDVEFVDADLAVGAIRELFELKKEGRIHHVGMSGYPLDYLLKLAIKVRKDLGQPLDLLLSYSNFCLQNTLLKEYLPRLKSTGSDGAGIRHILSASPLSMGLIRAQPAPGFHPASDELKAAISESAKYTESEGGVDLADLAVRFALRNWAKAIEAVDGPDARTARSYVYGLSSLQEVENAVKDYWQVKNGSETDLDEKLVAGVQAILKQHGQLNATWPSGIEHPEI